MQQLKLFSLTHVFFLHNLNVCHSEMSTLAGCTWKQSIVKNVNQSIHCVTKMYGSPDQSPVHGKLVLFNGILLLAMKLQWFSLVSGSPDPPLTVQVEAGPQEGTLLLTWLPVTISPSGVSNGVVVAGYVVYVDGRRSKEARGPTSES